MAGASFPATMEMKMKAILASVAAIAAISAAVPATAQTFAGQTGARIDVQFGGYNQPHRGGVYAPPPRFAVSPAVRMQQRIDMGVRNGSLSRNEAYRLHAQLRQVQQVEWRAQRDGRITAREAHDLDRRYAALDARIRVASRDVNRRYGSGYGNRW